VTDRMTLEVIWHAAVFAAEEMGVVLKNTAYSPNIKDRMDHSCAILSPEGELVAQAEHIPVHLGSMAVGALNVMKVVDLEPGDVVLVNDPYLAGTHLNDLMVLKPVHVSGRTVAMVANKAHHVDVGGSVPGSLGGDVSELLQEGLVIPPVKVVERGELREDLLSLLEANVRVPRTFRGDLKAQLAALNVGEKRISELAERYGAETVLEAWGSALDYTERYTREILRGAPEGSHRAEDFLEVNDSLLRIAVQVTVRGDTMTVNFTGTSKQVESPVNAVYGVTVASTSFSVKSVLDPEMPMNQGFLRAIRIEAPLGTIVNPVKPAPVSVGNVETSQRIADVVLRALAEFFPDRVPAASCGTMTNVSMGGRGWAFYETIGGGSGARPHEDGVDGVHTNMTNTRNTPVELIEREYPVLIEEYSLRRDSGGPGTYRGGLGIVRSYLAMEDGIRVSINCDRVKTSPWGLKGGKNGATAEIAVRRADGSVEVLPSKAVLVLNRGDLLTVKTPGGGGYGAPSMRRIELIEKDLLQEKISQEHARREYSYAKEPINSSGHL